MVNNMVGTPVQLVYSYSHQDEHHRQSMEKSLSLLERENLLLQWSDHKILPGVGISAKFLKEIQQADIVVFLLSPDFIASNACMNEWKLASDLVSQGQRLFRVPVIVRDCAWKDLLGEDDIKALPKDAIPVSQRDNQDATWLEVYEGIKSVVKEVLATFSPKEEFLNEIEATEFFSKEHIRLQELFVFPRLTRFDEKDDYGASHDSTMKNEDELLGINHALVHGQEKSGKTALARNLCLKLIEYHRPVLLLDLNQKPGGVADSLLRKTFQEQFHGDFSLWWRQTGKTLIVDNMNAAARSMDFIEHAKDWFDRIIVTMSSDIYYSFFRDDRRVIDFQEVSIEPLGHEQQECLIRKRLELIDGQQEITDGFVDRVEGQVNSVIISDKIVPRFPFYVLSILQTYEEYMPSNLSVTSYGHCYYMLIVGSLIRAGISKTDDEVGSCFNLTEHLAFQTYLHREIDNAEPFDFQAFLAGYKERFIIKSSTINRLMHPTFGVIDHQGVFRKEFMYYFFLGRFLAKNTVEGEPVVGKMCENSHREDNFLCLLFTIHHAQDNSIINDILLRTMCTLDSVTPAVLNKEETRRFRSTIEQLPDSILSTSSVEEERKRVREKRGSLSDADPEATEVTLDENPVNDIYRILKNNKIMGQILRNHYGTLEKSKVEEIINTIADSGLRLINVALYNEEDIARQAVVIKELHEDWNVSKIKQFLERVSFLWTLINLGLVVEAINIPEIRGAVKSVVQETSTPAYDLIGYFSQLAGVDVLDETERNELNRLLKKHDDMFIKRILSLQTQAYMNTHRSPAQIEQSICSLLNIKYMPRLLTGF